MTNQEFGAAHDHLLEPPCQKCKCDILCDTCNQCECSAVGIARRARHGGELLCDRCTRISDKDRREDFAEYAESWLDSGEDAVAARRMALDWIAKMVVGLARAKIDNADADALYSAHCDYVTRYLLDVETILKTGKLPQ